MIVLKIAALASLVASSAAIAQDAASAPVTAPTPAAEKKICRSEVPLGSIRTKRTCLTKSQWAALHAQNGASAERAIESVRSRANSGLNSAQ